MSQFRAEAVSPKRFKNLAILTPANRGTCRSTKIGMDSALAKIDVAKAALAEAKTLQEVKKIADLAEAARVYAQRSKAGKEVEMYAVEITLLAERRLGEMLKETTKNQGANGSVVTGRGRRPVKDDTPTLSDLGISKDLSSRAQIIVAIPEEHFLITIQSKSGNGTLSRSAILKEARSAQKKSSRQKIVSILKSEPDEIILPPYDIILADPAWRYSRRTTTHDRVIENQYPTLTVEQIIEQKPDSAKNAILFLWATAPLLPQALHVLEAWGFRYKTNAVLDKQKIGMGYWFRVQHELLLVGTKGKVSPPDEANRVSSIFKEERTTHSKKPDALIRAIPG
jgi:N6-adenosine-specific RNA methylase IME4